MGFVVDWPALCLVSSRSNMLHAFKDKLSSSVAQKFVNSRIIRYGEVRALRIDSRRKSGEIVGVLRGETEEVRVIVTRYSLESSQGKTSVRVDAVTCDRPWLENMLRDFICGRWFDLPGWASIAL